MKPSSRSSICPSNVPRAAAACLHSSGKMICFPHSKLLSDWKWELQLCRQLWRLWSSWRWASDDLWLGTEQQDTSLCRRRHPKAGGVVKMRKASCASSWKQLDGSIWRGGQWAGWQSHFIEKNKTKTKLLHWASSSTTHPSKRSTERWTGSAHQSGAAVVTGLA